MLPIILHTPHIHYIKSAHLLSLIRDDQPPWRDVKVFGSEGEPQ